MPNAIVQTKSWLEQVVIGLNFCPFAKKEWVNNTIHYQVSLLGDIEQVITEFSQQCQYLIDHPAIATSLLIYPQSFDDFYDYLDLVDAANDQLVAMGFEGDIQIASFHPDYCFAGTPATAAENYTNRSPYPMLHLIREASIERVLKTYPQPELIPEKNIAMAKAKGSAFFTELLKTIQQLS